MYYNCSKLKQERGTVYNAAREGEEEGENTKWNKSKSPFYSPGWCPSSALCFFCSTHCLSLVESKWEFMSTIKCCPVGSFIRFIYTH